MYNSRFLTQKVSCLLSLCIVFSSCHHNYPAEDKQQKEEVREHLMNANKLVVQDEAKEIDSFITHHQWKMQRTGTGLRIQIYEEGKGMKPNNSNNVSIAYRVFLLDGTLCDSATEQHPAKISLGSNEHPRGLEEGLMQMTEGSRARLIVPNHLGYGMTGNGSRIPPGKALYYEVHLIKIGN